MHDIFYILFAAILKKQQQIFNITAKNSYPLCQVDSCWNLSLSKNTLNQQCSFS